MPEKNLDFDAIIERKHTNSLKYDFAVQRGRNVDVLPLWGADMDFKASSYVQDALRKAVEHGIWGYSETQEGYFEAIRDWMLRHHGWRIEESWLVKTPGVVLALAMAIQAFTQPGDAVLIQQPVYYPFGEVIRDNGRKAVDNTLVEREDGYYVIDFADFEENLEKNIPEIKMREPEGTYLVWLDCRGLHLTERELEQLVEQKAGLWLDSGAMFGETGVGFQRINAACPRETLKQALEKLAGAVKEEQYK